MRRSIAARDETTVVDGYGGRDVDELHATLEPKPFLRLGACHRSRRDDDEEDE